jgi:hypothetical protein
MSLRIHAKSEAFARAARDPHLGAPDHIASKGGMIQSTTRLSRGARLRRPRPVWLYGVIILAGVVLGGLGLVIFKH